MRFDYTKGEEAKYVVSLYNWNINDHLYYHTYKEAKEHFNKLKNGFFPEGTVVSIYDLKKDVRKAFKKF